MVEKDTACSVEVERVEVLGRDRILPGVRRRRDRMRVLVFARILRFVGQGGAAAVDADDLDRKSVV